MGMHGPEPGWDVWRSTILSNLAVTGVENYAAAAASDSTTPETSGVRAALSGPTA